MGQALTEMTKELVIAMIGTGSLAADDVLPKLKHIYETLKNLEDAEAGIETPPSAESMDWRKSIKKQSIVCMQCGAEFKQISARHLRLHDLNPKSYRALHSIPADQPLSAKATTERRRQIAAECRPWEKAPTFLKHREAEEAAKIPVKKGRAKRQAVGTN